MTALPPRETADSSGSGRPNDPLEPDPAEPARWRIIVGVAVVVALAVLLAVVLLRETSPPSDPRTDAVDGVATNPDAAEPPGRGSASFAPSDEPPPPLDGLVGEDFEAVVRTQYHYWEWLYQHPSGAGGQEAAQLLDNIYHPNCPCRVQERLLSHYAEQGWWWTGGEIRILSVEVLDRPTSDRVHVQAVVDGPGTSKLIDSGGTVHDVAPPREPWVEERIYVREGRDLPWRLLDGADQGPMSDPKR